MNTMNTTRQRPQENEQQTTMNTTRQRPPRLRGKIRYRTIPVGVLLVAFVALIVSGAALAFAAEMHPFSPGQAGQAKFSGEEPPTPAPAFSLQHEAFQVVSETIEADVPLGGHRQFQLTVQNVTTSTLRPVFYEAWPAPAPGLPDSAASAELRQVALPEQEERLDPQIMADLAASSDGETTFFVFLEDQPDLSAAYEITDWSERGQFVYQTLTAHAERTQQDIRSLLNERGTDYEPLWITNALVVHGNKADIQSLESRQEVALLRADYSLSLYDEAQESGVSGCEPDENGTCWNILQVGADRTWRDFGVSGQGVTVASLDSGVRYTHRALSEQYRGYRGPDSYDHNYNWYDAVFSSPVPVDAGNHGSHTMGTMVGRSDGSYDQPAIGVAPGARWISARICETSSCRESDILMAAQWMLAPTDQHGNNPRPDLRPHVINNSWSTGTGGVQSFVDFVTAWRASGIFPVFAAGNSPLSVSCGSVASPGDYATVVGVGATDKSGLIASYSRVGPAYNGNIKPDIVAPGSYVASTFAGNDSSYGAISGTSMATPHIVGAVALIWSANPSLIGDFEATYEILTESATPRTDDRFSKAIYAECKAEISPNNVYGYGFLNTYAAVAEATIDVPWLELSAKRGPVLSPDASGSVVLTLDAAQISEPGTYQARVLVSTGDLSQTPYPVDVVLHVTLPDQWATISGQVHDARTVVPLSQASVIVDGGLRLVPDETGFYSVTLPLPEQQPSYTQTLVVENAGYVRQTVAVSLTDGAHRVQDFAMEPDRPIITIGPDSSDPFEVTLDYGEKVNHTIPISNVGTQPLVYEVKVPFEQFSVWRSDESPGITRQWYTIPSDAKTIELKDDAISDPVELGFQFPFSNTLYSQVRVGANGLLIFGKVNQTNGFVPWNFSTTEVAPLPETDAVAIMPLRTDLNPEGCGTIRYTWAPEGFVVAYENVPLFDKPEQTFTFQVMLSPNGDIAFHYKKLSAVPKYTTVGMQFSRVSHQILGEGNTVPITSNLSLQLRPQPESRRWLVSQTSGGRIAPDDGHVLPIEIRWVLPYDTQPYRGTILVQSNDGDRPAIEVPILLRVNPFLQEIIVPGADMPDQSIQTLTVTNTDGYSLSVRVMPGTFAHTTTVAYTQEGPPELQSWPEGTTFLVHSFTLSASQENSLAQTVAFNTPMTITLRYDPTGMDEQEERSLMLFSWQGDTWQPVGTPADYRYDLERNEVAVAIEAKHLGHLALFYEETIYPTYLPIVQR
jgi:subtilisin family serine protease